MARATVSSLNDRERSLINETTPDALRDRTEDELIALHGRIRRERDKQVKLHRRQTAARVEQARSRGTASAGPRRSASKAELFEDALARVSSRLAKAATASAAELRAERLEAARGGAARPATPAADAAAAAAPNAAPARGRARQPVERKTVAAQRASGARRQARGDQS